MQIAELPIPIYSKPKTLTTGDSAMNIYIPFTYIISWSNHKKFYYGTKYAQGCQPSDLWESYFTSSEYVEDFRKENGEPDIIRIHRTFIDAESCVAFEHKYLTKIDAKNNPLFLNKHNGGKNLGIWDDESKEKKKQSCLEKYGVENVMQSPQVKEKSKETCLENWGVENVMQSPIVKEKSKQTLLENWGVERVSQIERPCKHCGELKNINHEVRCKQNPNRKLNPSKLPFFSIISTKKTYGKNNLSRYFPEFKQFY
jgi:hypothetical protein